MKTKKGWSPKSNSVPFALFFFCHLALGETHPSAPCSFDYKSFWTELEHIFDSPPPSPPPSPCPKVYIYDLPDQLADSSPELLACPYGKNQSLKYAPPQLRDELQERAYNTAQYAFPAILESRIRNSEACRTTDPTKADLFFPPIFTKPKWSHEWDVACHNVTSDTVVSALPHLTSSNQCRHFFAVGKGHRALDSCFGWFRSPSRELENVLRVSYSHSYWNKAEWRYHVPQASLIEFQQERREFPHLFSVPYPSFFHFYANDRVADLPQFRFLRYRFLHAEQQRSSNTSILEVTNQIKDSILTLSPALSSNIITTKTSSFIPRTALMSFFGTPHNIALRKRIITYCTNNPHLCSLFPPNEEGLYLKSHSVFCLEPVGDSPWRKSVWDSLIMGCIPVLFAETTDNVAPWFWGDWKERARLLVPYEDYMAGCVDLGKLLGGIPERVVRMMQKTIRDKVRMAQYSLDEDLEDGVKVLLDNLLREAKRLEKLGHCSGSSVH